MKNFFMAVLVALISHGAYAQNTAWKPIDGKTDTWERLVIIEKQALRVEARVLRKEKRVFLVAHYQCKEDTIKTERLEWYAGDTLGTFVDCIGRRSQSTQGVIIEDEIRQGLPKP